MKIPYAAQLAEVRRELGLRRHLYPKWVQKGTMTQAAADRQIEIMEAVESTLVPLAKAEELI